MEKYLDRPGNRAGIGDAEVASFLYQKWCRYAEDLDDYFYEEYLKEKEEKLQETKKQEQ